MFDPISECREHPQQSDSRSAREKQHWRNAAARRKLEALRERKLLRKQLTDVWDEAVNHH